MRAVGSAAWQPRAVVLPDDPPAHLERLRVRYSDTDAQGIAHHSNYFRWLEEARIGWLEAQGSDYGALNARGIFIPITACGCRFLLPATAGDEIEVSLWLVDASRAQARFVYAIHRDQDVLATASSAHAFVDGSGAPRRLARDDPFWRRLRGCVSPA